MVAKKLKNAPLQEAIFELFWNLPLDQKQFPYDPHFDLAQGKFDDLIKQYFGVHKRTLPAGVNIKIYPKPIHQYWKAELAWPVVQFGPGILTLNDTDKNYIWEDNFRPNIEIALECLLLSYKREIPFNKVSLKYIDSVDLPESDIEPNEFIRKNFQTEITNHYSVPGQLSGLNINQIFTLNDGTKLSINIQTAKNNINKKNAIVWITGAEKTGQNFLKEQIMEWVDQSHQILSDTFVKMLNVDFYAQFNK